MIVVISDNGLVFFDDSGIYMVRVLVGRVDFFVELFDFIVFFIKSLYI